MDAADPVGTVPAPLSELADADPAPPAEVGAVGVDTTVLVAADALPAAAAVSAD